MLDASVRCEQKRLRSVNIVMIGSVCVSVQLRLSDSVQCCCDEAAAGRPIQQSVSSAVHRCTR